MIFDVYQLSLYCISIYTVSIYVWMSPVYIFIQEYISCFSAIWPSLATLLLTLAVTPLLVHRVGRENGMQLGVGRVRRYATKGRYDHQTFLVHPNYFCCKILDLLYQHPIFLNRKDCQGCISKGYQSYDIVFAHHKTAWVWYGHPMGPAGSGHFWRKPTVAPRSSRPWCFCLEPQSC